MTDAREVGDEMVIEEGVRRITADQDAAAAQVRYVAVRLKEGDRWTLASYREFADDPLPTGAEMLAPLDWLVGDWVDESPEGTTRISYRWSDDGNFLLGDYNLSVGGPRGRWRWRGPAGDAERAAAVVASSPYDYSQPVIVENATPAYASLEATEPQPAEQPSPANAAVDAALAKFKAGDYVGALAGFDKALRLSPKDAVIHEVRALALFALGRYPEAAAALNAVLATAPGMDWTTMSNVYGSVDAYTDHLRKLEEFCRTHPDDAAAHFVLGYHYLVGGSTDMAAAALRIVVAKKPDDVVAKRLLEAISPPEDAQPAQDSPPTADPTGTSAPGGAAAPDIDLVGTWKATSGKDTIRLEVADDSTFSWQAQPSGKPPVELSGTIETAADAIALVSKSAGTMVAKVTPQGADSFGFSLPAAPQGTPPLVFARQP